jgi:glucosamine kinase
MNLLIADSGATKTDWAYIQNGKPVYMRSSGLHPAYLDRNKVIAELKKLFHSTSPDSILFYGAGCYSEDSCLEIKKILIELFGNKPIDIFDDLTSVAHAFLGKGDGIAGILGTGSASGYFTGGYKIKQVSSLGYILGDEGSGADVGKRILKSIFRSELSGESVTYLESKLGSLEYSKMMQQLYSAERPSYYLSSLAGKVASGDYTGEIRQIVESGFQAYIDHHLKMYEESRSKTVTLAGGMVKGYTELLSDVLVNNGYTNYRLAGSVITALAEQKSNKING